MNIRLLILAFVMGALGALQAADTTRNSILQTAIVPFLESEDTSDQYNSVVDRIAHSVNASGAITANGLAVWDDAIGEQLRSSGIIVSGSDMSGILILTATTVIATNLLGTVSGQTVEAVVLATEDVETATSAAIINTLVLRDANGDFSVHKIYLDAPLNLATSAVTKAYVDTTVLGLIKTGTVRVILNAPSGLSGLSAIDDITLVDGDRVLAMNQADPVDNGIWIAHSGSWTRPLAPTPMYVGYDALGAYIEGVNEGTVFGGTSWASTATATALVGTAELFFGQFSLQSNVTGNSISDAFDVYYQKEGSFLLFSSINGSDGAGTGVTITQALNANDITISAEGPILVPIGTVALPGIQFSSNTDNGIYAPNSTTVVLDAGGTVVPVSGRVVILNTGVPATSTTTVNTDLVLPVGIEYASAATLHRNFVKTSAHPITLTLTKDSDPLSYAFNNETSFFGSNDVDIIGTAVAVPKVVSKNAIASGNFAITLTLATTSIGSVHSAFVRAYWVPGVTGNKAKFVYREGRS